MLFCISDIVHRLNNPAAEEGLVVATILFDEDRRPLAVARRPDFTGTDLLSEEDDLVVVQAFLEELEEAAKDPQRLAQYIQEVFEGASLSLRMEAYIRFDAESVVAAEEMMVSRF